MGMTVSIVSGEHRQLDLHFSSSNHDGQGKWGTLHIAIADMQWQGAQLMPVSCLQCELEHDDIDRLIMELLRAKGMLAGHQTYAPDHPCSQCGFKLSHHSYSLCCMEKLSDGKWTFSQHRRFTP